ncbi:hypothetical protein [Photobacterium damselae]|nr:hypothetical protein [Photobacterium damselae]
MSKKTFLVSLALSVGTAVLSAYLIKKMNGPEQPSVAALKK